MKGTTAQAKQLGFAPERLARIDGWMARQVDEGKLAGLSANILRHGALAYSATHGMADIGGGVPMADDTIVRIYSMTKALSSTAIMMLYEEGRFQLDDPITRFLPAFRDMRVYAGGNKALFQTVPAVRDITFRDLLTHTSGLTYGFMDETPVDALYRETGVDFQTSEATLGEVVEKAAAPLRSAWMARRSSRAAKISRSDCGTSRHTGRPARRRPSRKGSMPWPSALTPSCSPQAAPIDQSVYGALRPTARSVPH